LFKFLRAENDEQRDTKHSSSNTEHS
jgi:hypothetical protein